MGFRRNRAGRRKAGETRLRESQSLNRITEVQESDVSLGVGLGSGSQNNHNGPINPSQQAPLAQSEITDSRVPSPESPLSVLCPDQDMATRFDEELRHTPPQVTVTVAADIKKPKGFSARLLQGFKSRTSNKHEANELKEQAGENINAAELSSSKCQKENMSGEGGKMGGGGGGGGNTGQTTTTRKLKMLGKYFQVSI